MFAKLFAAKRPEASYPKLPAVDARGQTSVRGLYAVGEVAGTPLVKLGLNAGHALALRLADELAAEGQALEGALDVVIVGAGAAGLGAAAAAQERGLSFVILEANRLAETVQTMTKGKLLLAEPEAVALESRMWFAECRREELLDRWRAQVRELGFELREHEKVEDIRRSGALLVVSTTKQSYRARRVILATGKAGNPRKAGVSGEVEHAAKIEHRLVDPELYSDLDVLIYGGGDVALEAAVALADTNRVTLVTIDEEFTYPKKRNVDALRSKEAEGRVEVFMGSWLDEVGERDASFRVGGSDGERRTIPNDRVFEMIGAELPLGFFAKIGVKLENAWSAKRWVVLALVFLAVHALYALKSYGKGAVAWPYEGLAAPEAYDRTLRAVFELAFAPFAWLFEQAAYADILADRGYQQGFLYSLCYTVVMLVFGFEAMLRWRGVARRKGYQTWRYASLLAFQLGFFLIVNLVAVQALSTKYAWRAWGLYQPFPLFFNTFFWWYDGDPAGVFWLFVGAGLLGTFVAIPLLARRHGKRFCTWVCGCGGLAETLGDRWRHLAPKGARSRAWEFQAVVILAASVLVGLVVVGQFGTDGNNLWWRVYSYLVDFWLVAVIPIALYPFFGGKVWCRYWCPLAAWNGLLARWYGKLRIKSSDQCIACTQCSKYCQVGVDVMAFAKNQEAFDNRNSACIQCGVCVDVCPMDVLAFDTSSGQTAGHEPASPSMLSGRFEPGRQACDGSDPKKPSSLTGRARGTPST